MAAEIERTEWTQFKSYLDKNDKKMFDQMYDYVKLHNAACSNACRPVVIYCNFRNVYPDTIAHHIQYTKR